MTADEFLDRWLAEHIVGSTRQTDAATLVDKFSAEAPNKTIRRDELEMAAERNLDSYLMGCSPKAIEDESR